MDVYPTACILGVPLAQHPSLGATALLHLLCGEKEGEREKVGERGGREGNKVFLQGIYLGGEFSRDLFYFT
jgi:hypothetical protein